MANKLTKEWLLAALMRALRTVAQTALSLMTVGVTLQATNWIYILSVAASAGVYSIMTSFATGLPETVTSGTIQIDTTNPEQDKYFFEFSEPLENLATRKVVSFTVNAHADLSQK